MAKRMKLTYTQMIATGFLGLIALGALLLCLPISSRSGCWTPFTDALFTATSATCVTGLVVYDTYTHWSLFGQAVILSMIQIGGVGVMTLITLFSRFLRRQISLKERKLMMQSAGGDSVGGVRHLVRHILLGTALFEGMGAIALAVRFCPQMGLLPGLWNAVFHSVSAFCNAGFDVFGKTAPFGSVAGYADDPFVLTVFMCLIVLGGLGFLVWGDIIHCRFRFAKYRLHTKIVLVTTAGLVLGSVTMFLLLENNHLFADFSIGKKITNAFFMAISPRTAGFDALGCGNLSGGSWLLTVALMIIGGSPGSTAGGMKTTTFAVLLLSAMSSAKKSNGITVFKRQLDSDALKQASAIGTIYILAVVVSAILISLLEPFSIREILFETASAIGTVGLTCGITPFLGAASKLIIVLLMFAGRIGGLSLMMVLAEKRSIVPANRPVEAITIG